MPPADSPTTFVQPQMRTPPLAHRLVTEFTDKIQSGKLAAGSKLPTENEIARENRVSRAVVREALSRLQAAGLVESRQGIGTFVLARAPSTNFRIDPATVVTMRDVLALLEVRMSFEIESAYLAAIRRTDEQLAHLGDCVERIQALLDQGQQTTDTDFEFHLGIAAATGNRYFTDILNHLGLAILPRTRVDLRYIAASNAAEYLNRSNREHRDIHQAIARRDGDGARAAMRIHLGNSRQRLQELTKETEF
jgi:GntR family transcriptional repressor for pyruvate dehydrogenase complex